MFSVHNNLTEFKDLQIGAFYKDGSTVFCKLSSTRAISAYDGIERTVKPNHKCKILNQTY